MFNFFYYLRYVALLAVVEKTWLELFAIKKVQQLNRWK